MEINYLAVLVCGVVALVIGSIWYGPLFGKFWMQMMGADSMSPDQKEAMKKNMWVMYAIQFVLSAIMAGALSVHLMNWAGPESSLAVAVCIWFGFVMTTSAGAALWSGKPPKVAFKMFLITAVEQLITFVAFALILGAWM